MEKITNGILVNLTPGPTNLNLSTGSISNTNKVNPNLAKQPLSFNGGPVKLGLTSLV